MTYSVHSLAIKASIPASLFVPNSYSWSVFLCIISFQFLITFCRLLEFYSQYAAYIIPCFFVTPSFHSNLCSIPVFIPRGLFASPPAPHRLPHHPPFSIN